jgi:hypothetical protein
MNSAHLEPWEADHQLMNEDLSTPSHESQRDHHSMEQEQLMHLQQERKNIRATVAKKGRKRPKSTSSKIRTKVRGSTRLFNDASLKFSSSHFQFRPGHNRSVGGVGTSSNIIRPLPRNIQSKQQQQLQQIELMRSQLSQHGSSVDQSSSLSSLNQVSSLHLPPSFSFGNKSKQIINGYKRRRQQQQEHQTLLRKDCSPLTKRRPRPNSAITTRRNDRRYNGGKDGGNGKKRRPKTAGNFRESGSMPSLLDMKRRPGGGSSLFDRNNNSADNKLRELRSHLRSIVQVKHDKITARTSNMNMETYLSRSYSDVGSSGTTRDDSNGTRTINDTNHQSKFAPGLKANTDHFIHWLSNDWKVDSNRMQREAARRRDARRAAAEKADELLNIRQDERTTNNEEDYSDECNSEEEDDEASFYPAVDDFTNWVSDAWPGIVERRRESGAFDSRKRVFYS